MSSPTRNSSRAMNPGQVIAAFLAFILFAGVGGVLAAGLVMPVVATTGAVAQAGSELFDELPTELGSEKLSEQTVMLDRNGKLLARFYMWNRIVVSMDKIDPNVANAVVAVEDHRFFEHGGVDPEGIMRAAFTNLSGGSMQGGSTLTQQYVKNVLVENARVTDDSEAYRDAVKGDLGRKLREAKLAISLEKSRSKEQILEGYLNIAQFGVGIWGVEAAARYFFNHSAAELSPAEAALLAGITNAPSKYDPVRNPENAETRRNHILGLMLDQEFITEEEYEEGKALTVEEMLDLNPTPSGCGTVKSAAYFCDYVKQIILQDKTFGETKADRFNLLMQGGLTITTTIDPELQKLAHASLVERVPENDPSGISNATSTVEPGTGEVMAMAQNTTFGDATEDSPRATQINFNTDENYGGSQGFQTGSTFKAFVLTAWLQAGKSLHDIIPAPPKATFPRSVWTYNGCTDSRPNEPYPVSNIEQSASRLTVLDATRRSSNTGFVHMASQLNMCDIAKTAESMGVHLAAGPNEHGDLLNYNASFVIGTNNIAPLTMSAAFATYAANGVYCKPIAILSVTDTNGEELPIPEADCKQVLDPSVVAGVNHALQAVTSPSGTANLAGISGRPTAGKTGTSNSNYDAWFVGYVPQLSTAVWVGHSEGQESMNYQRIGGRWYGMVYGGAMAAPIWHNIMKPATEEMEKIGFAKASEKMIYGERKQVPVVKGMSVDDATRTLVGEGFNVSVGEPGYSGYYPKGVVGWQSSEGRARPGTSITIRVSEGPEPEPEPTDDPSDGGRSNDNGRDQGNGGRGRGNSNSSNG